MQYVDVVTDDSILVLNTSTGDQVKFYTDDARYEKALKLLVVRDYDAIFKLDAKYIVSNFTASDSYGDVEITVKDGDGFVYIREHDITVKLHPSITKRIMKMNEQVLDSQPLINFISNMYDNPSKTAVDELYLFLEACELPITEDGHFIAYKIVKNDYKDIYSGTLDNSIGKTVSMPRNAVDDDRNRTCSAGLHFCSKDYLSHYGSGSRSNDRCILVKINPADVVSIPADYNNAKGRTWQYTVVGEVKDSDWRKTLSVEDYTTSAVVDSRTGLNDVAYNSGFEDGKRDAIDSTFEEFDYSSTTNQEVINYNRGYDCGYLSVYE